MSTLNMPLAYTRCFVFCFVFFFLIFFVKSYVVGTHLNCISMQFKWVPTTYAL